MLKLGIIGGLIEKLGYPSLSYAQAPIESTTIWTPEKFIAEIAEAPKITYVHWRWEGIGDNTNGDKMVEDFSRDATFLDKIVIIELSKYDRNIGKILTQLPGNYNLGREGIRRLPNGSLFKNKREFRIKSPPRRQHYAEDYLTIKQAMTEWLARV